MSVFGKWPDFLFCCEALKALNSELSFVLTVWLDFAMQVDFASIDCSLLTAMQVDFANIDCSLLTYHAHEKGNHILKLQAIPST